MVTFGGTEVMLLAAALSGVVFMAATVLAARRMGWLGAIALTGFVWSIFLIAVATLVPAQGPPGYLQPEDVQTVCSFDIGGPAPEGFGIFGGTQRALNTLLFVPSGVLLVVASARWRIGWILAPLGLLALAAYSVGIEIAQLELARIDRSCDATDVVDNTTGAALGFAIGLVLIVILRPWRHRRPRTSRGA